MHIQGKVALISGSASGIGLAIATELLKNDILGIVIVDINKNVGEFVKVKLAKKFGKGRIVFYKADVTSNEEFEAAFMQAINCFGKLDIVVNNAGVMNDVNYSLCIATNLIAVIRGTELGLKYMDKNQNGDGGVIINIASVAALEFHFTPVYSAAKAGSVTLVRGLGHRFFYDKTGVKVLALCPGATFTSMLSKPVFRQGCILGCIRDFLKNSSLQMPESVGLSAIYLIKNAESGTVWISESNDLFKVDEPNLDEHKKLVIHSVSDKVYHNYYYMQLAHYFLIFLNVIYMKIKYFLEEYLSI